MGNGAPVLLKGIFNEDTSAHNFITQTIFDYGLIVAFPFFLLLYNVWKKSGLYYKTLMLYLLIIGLSQPYFSFGVPTQFTLIIILIAILAQNSDSRLNILAEEKYNE